MKIIQRLGQTKRIGLLTFCCFMFAMVVTFMMERPALFDPYVVQNDARQHVYWMARFQDPELFKDDALTDFASRPRAAPYGFVALYYLASFFVDPLLFSKLLPILLIPLCAAVLFRLGYWLKDALSGIILIILFLGAIWDVDRFTGGLAHSFSYPIVILFLYSLVRKRYLVASTLLVVGALFYPPIVLVCAGAWAISFLDVGRLRVRIPRADLVPFLTGSVLTLGVLMLIYIAHEDEAAGPWISYSEATHMQEFYPGGRVSYFYGTLAYHYLQAERSGLGLTGPVYILFLVTVFIALVLRSELFSSTKEIWHLMFSSLCAFVLAHLFLFKLFLPSRYAMAAIPISLMMLVSIHLRPAIQKVVGLIMHSRFQTKRPVVVDVGAVALALGFFVLCMRLSDLKVVQFRHGGLTNFIASLPKDTLIAGHPVDMDWIPIFSKRKVLVNRELSLPYYVDYYRMIRERTNDILNAYYSDSEADIAGFCRKHNVDYLVVNKGHFSLRRLQSDRIYDEPYNTLIKAKIADRQRFAVLEIPAEATVWQNEKFTVADCHRMAETSR